MKIAIIEDEIDLINNLIRAIELEGFSAYGFRSGEDFWWKFAELSPDIILIDRNLPGIDGLSLVRQIREKDPTVPILVVTADIRDEEAVEGFEAGADDYVRKPFAVNELISRIKVWIHRKKHTSPEPLQNLDWELDKTSLCFNYRGQKTQLTRTELNLLNQLLKHPNQVVPRKNLLKGLSNTESKETRSLDVHISSIRKKLKDMGIAIESLRSVGYRLTF